jgi:hypothetical protein
MGFDRVLAHEKLLGDLAVAHASRDEFENLKLGRRDAEVRSFLLVRHKRFPG